MSADRLLDGLTRLRRRAALTRGATRGLAGGWVGLGVGESARILVFDGAMSPLTFTLPLVAAGVGAGALAAWWRRPSLLEAARAVDRAAGLPATVVTALGVHHERDLFAMRIVADGASALTSTQGRHVYPWRIDTVSRWLLALGAAGLSATLLVPDRGAARDEAGRRDVRSGGPAGQAADAGRAPGTGQSATAAEPGSPRPSPPATRTDPEPAAGDEPSAPTQEAVRAEARPGGALEALEGMSPGASTAPGGGSTSGDGAPGAGTSGGSGRGGSATGAGTADAGMLERVPMSRRAYVRRYVQALPGPETR